MKRIPGIALGLVVVLVGVLAWYLLSEAGAGDEGPADVLRASQATGGQAASGLDEALAPAAGALEVPAAATRPLVDEAAVARMPDSYRRALGTLTGRVLLNDGTPLPGLPLELLGGRRSLIIRSTTAFLEPGGLDLDPVVAHAVTDAEGRFRLSDLQPRTLGVLLLDPGGPRALLWPLEITPVAGATRDLGDLRLPATATLRGRVVDARNQPLAGARVRATEVPYLEMVPDVAHFRTGGGVVVHDEGESLSLAFVPPPSLSAQVERLPVPTTRTGADGSFELTGVIPGLVCLAVDHPDYLAHVQGGLPTGAAGGVRDLGSIGLADGEAVAGRVVDDQGRPVAGAQVLLGSPLGVAPVAIVRGPLVTDAEGAFRARGFRPGALWAAARSDPRHDWTVVTELQAGAPAEIRLELPRTLTLLVHGGDGVPLDGVELWGRAIPDDDIVDLLIPPQALPEVRRDADGRHVVPGLKAAQWEIIAKAPGRPLERDEFDLREADRAGEIRLGRGRDLAVRVVGPDGAPLEWVALEAYDGPVSFEDAALATARTGADGRALLRDLPPAKVHVLATHPGYAVAQASQDLSLPPETPPEALPPAPELLMALESGARLVGQVVDGGNPPAEPLMAILVPDDDGAPGDSLLPLVTVTDLEGAFTFDNVQPGQAHVEVRSRTNFTGGLLFFEAFIESPLAEEEIEIRAGTETRVLLDVAAQFAGQESGTLAGSLTVNGLPAAGWRVRAWGEIRRSVTTDARGQFDLGRLLAGDLDLTLAPPEQRLAEGITERVEVTLAAGERKFVELRLSTGAVSGRVTSAATGRPLAAARVQVVAGGESRGWGRMTATFSGEDGRFVLEPVAAGSYSLNVRAEGHANLNTEPFEVREGQTHGGVEVRLARALTVSGSIRVEGAERDPNWVWLVATASDGKTRDNANVDREALTYSFDGLSAGEWSVELASDLDVEFAPATLRVDGDREDVELVFVPAPDAPPPPSEDEPDVTIEVGASGG